MKQIVLASNNAHKLREMQQILGPGYRILSLSDIGCHADIPETGLTLEENSLIKARYIASRYGIGCIADDTGLEVAALGGQPGVRSARYAPGEGHDSQANMQLLLHNLSGIDDRQARFRTVITLIEDGEEHQFEGIVEGEITRVPQGTDGFGYDPVFRPLGSTMTFAQMPPEAKNAISHRARATMKLKQHLNNTEQQRQQQ